MFGGEFHKPSDATKLRINNDMIQRFLKPNDVVYIDDGKVIGIVSEIDEIGVKMEIKIGGYVKANATVRFTGGKHAQLPLLADEDFRDLAFIS